jgi:hypothetical protein
MSDEFFEERCHIKNGSPEWNKAWALIGKDFTDQEQETGEVWQYMGTGKHDGNWVHEFRHRCHPITKTRVYIQVLASDNFDPDEDKYDD